VSDKSGIEWTNATLNLVVGCQQVSPGCDNCYAKRLNDTRMMANPKSPRFGVPFETLTFHPERIKMLKAKAGKRIFVNSMSDLFHKDVPTEVIQRAFADFAAAPQHTFQILTKRPERMRRVVTESMVALNIHLGVSIESADYAWRADHLRETPAAVRFLSLEPLLGHIPAIVLKDLDWVIVGGESGSIVRPMDLAWARDIRDDCQAMGIPFFFKQVAAHRPNDDMIPPDLRLREYPEGVAALDGEK